MIASVIVPAYNAETLLPKLLESLRSQEGLTFGQDYEIIVVDDGSSDLTSAIPPKYGAQVLTQPNAGPAAARNHGAHAAQAPLLAFTDADCIPAPDWLASLLSPFADPQVIGVKGVYRTHERGTIPRFVQAEYAHKYERMNRLPQIDFVDTYSAAYRRENFLSEGGFDERFPVPSVEDQEFSFRLARKGYKMVFQPQAAVYHHHDRTLAEYIRRKFGIGYWKAFLLRQMPEKARGDSHTSPTQPLEILAVGLLGLGLLLAFFHPAGWGLACLGLAAFLILTMPLRRFIQRYDPAILWVAFFLILIRALALGFGLVAGFLSPKTKMRSVNRFAGTNQQD
ncbi:MAG: glycosyltransferase [Anaerolineaceae bacterium]|nr:glycosyltransferase [Anaerolineaceae bacterium]